MRSNRGSTAPREGPAVIPTYEDVLAQVARISAKKVIPPAELERMMRLLVIARRCCNGPQMLGLDVDERRVPKLEELREHLKDLSLGEGRKVVVFSEWTDMTNRVEALCGRLKLPVFHLHGGVPVRRRPALLRAFAAGSGTPSQEVRPHQEKLTPLGPAIAGAGAFMPRTAAVRTG